MATHGGGQIGTVVTEGDIINRHLTAAQLTLNAPGGGGLRGVVAVDLVDFDNHYVQEARSGARFADPDLPPTREIGVADRFAAFREAYLDWQFSDIAALRVGRQTMVWGQFEFLTPVGFLMPYRGSNTSTRCAALT